MSTQCRVAQIIRKLGDGGIESFVYNYYRAIDHSIVQFDIFYHSDSVAQPSQDLIDQGVRFFSVPPYQKNLIGYIKALRRYFRENHYDIVHSNMNTISVFSLYAAKRERIPVRIVHNHSIPGGDEFVRNVIKYLLRPFSTLFATDLFACSETAARWMYGTRLKKGLVHVIPNAVDFSRYRCFDSSEVDALRQRLHINGRAVIGHVGRYCYAKNHAFLLDLVKKLRGMGDDVVLLLVGNGELERKINEKIEALGIQEDVIQVGWIDEPEIYYGLMDVFVFPSYYEGLGMALIEAQVSGIPCVVSQYVPDETRISKEYSVLDLDNRDKWVDEIRHMIGLRNTLDLDYVKYDVLIQGPKLMKYYENRMRESINGEK